MYQVLYNVPSAICSTYMYRVLRYIGKLSEVRTVQYCGLRTPKFMSTACTHFGREAIVRVVCLLLLIVDCYVLCIREAAVVDCCEDHPDTA